MWIPETEQIRSHADLEKMEMRLLDHVRSCVRANRLANRRLHAAMIGLPAAEFQAPRTGFFPSLAATLNHILAVDIYYIAALHR